ncbi:hypothetical protein DUI87_22211 [Hirundo rustica rustica]|uniref:Peptidase A2 domain-containing protein n=1 Tax=Hirundo rustica rustica TaxID=333673 RepID=A0A3M0JJG7_HIRRU|nr:hypothetical protein DUI87_22211 [Hirundo rustica rustica]
MILNLISTSRSPSINRVAVEQEDQEEEEMEMDRMEDDEGRNPDLEDHGLGYPTQHEWFASSYPNSKVNLRVSWIFTATVAMVLRYPGHPLAAICPDSRHQPYRLRLTEGLHLRNADWTIASVNTEEQGAWPAIEGEFIVIGDCKHTPQEIEILPGMLVNNPGRFVLWLRCTHPPTYLSKGQIIAQIIPTRGPTSTPETPVACPVQAITAERPRVASVAEERPTQKLNWKTDSPVWVEQWPLSREKLKALEELIEEQLAKGHIIETNSPWNSLVFVIKKPGKDKWRLLHDLRQINNVIEDMGSLQPGMPSPAMLGKLEIGNY